MKCVFPTHFILDANIWGYFMTAAIVDDLIKDIPVLEEYLKNYCQEHKVHIQVHRFTSESAFLQSLDQTEYSLVFLDIYMQNETGIRLAQQVRRTFPRCQVIFTTASKEHALEAFRVRALDSVSYTHLDVYKRQPSMRSSRISNLFGSLSHVN